MKSRRLSLVVGLLVTIIMVATLCMFGCKAEPATPEQKTVKVGLIAYLGWSTGLDILHGVELMVDNDNDNGGLDIGGERYNVELLAYDSNNSQSTEVAALNRLIFEDKVKYILSDGTFTAAWLATAEENKVLTIAMPGDVSVNQVPDIHYSCNPSTRDANIRVAIGWFCENYPEMAKDTLTARPDSQIGHIVTGITGAAWEAFGVTPLSEFYPADATDLSALGTKVVTMNPAAFGAEAGGVLQDALAYKAVCQAGYQGQFFSPLGALTSTLVKQSGAEAVEGLISPLASGEADPPPTEVGREYKDLWIAKYGDWVESGGETSDPSLYLCLRAALQQAGSLGVDEAAAVLFNGMQYDSPGGIVQMVSRPDLGNERTIAAMSTVYLKQIKGGKNTILATIEPEKGVQYVQKAYEYAAQQPPPSPPK